MVKNVRTYTSRTKTGCLTCRRRRIKCDEAKPACWRCVAGKRPCEGYAGQTNNAASTSTAAAPLRMIVYTPATPAYPSAEPERDAFRFFLAQSRGCFPADFSRAVLQAAQLDRVFTHAIVSFGAAQQIYEYEDDPATRDRLGNLAMMQYGKALHLLQNPVHPCSVEVLLLCCVLFACFESLRGCRRSAVVHIKSGLDLLRQSGGPQAKWSLVSRETMTAIFTRLDNQIVELLGTHVNETVKDDKSSDKVYYPGPLTVKLPVSDLGISIDTHLNHLFHRQLRLALIAGGRLPTPDDLPTSAETPIALGRQKALFKTEDLDTALLQIWQLMAELYITVDTGSEEAWDPFVEDFATIVRLSEAYLSRERPRSQKRIFVFSIGVIPPLYMAAARCRDPHIRREAIRLMAAYPRREVMWDSTMAAEVARQVLEIEEGDGDGDGPAAAGSAADSSSTVSNNALSSVYNKPKPPRVRTVTAVLNDEDGARFEFVQ